MSSLESLEPRRFMDGGSAPMITSVEPIDFQHSKVTFQLSKDNIGNYPALIAHSAQMTYYGPDVGVSVVDFNPDTGQGWGTLPTFWGTNYQITFWSVYASGESDAEAGQHSITPPAPPAPSSFTNEATVIGSHPAVLGRWQRNGSGFAERQWYYGDQPGDAPTYIGDYNATSPGSQYRAAVVQYPGAHRIGVQNFIIDPDNNFQETTAPILSGDSVIIKPPPPSAPGGVQVMHDTTPDDISVTVNEDNRVFANTGYELQREDVSLQNWQTIWFGFPANDAEQWQVVTDAAVPIGPTYRYRVRAVAPDVNGNLIDGDWIEGANVSTQHHYFVAWSASGNQTTNLATNYGIAAQPVLYKDGRRYQAAAATVTFTVPDGMRWMFGGSTTWTWNSGNPYNVLFDDTVGSGTYAVNYVVSDGGASVGSGVLYVRIT